MRKQLLFSLLFTACAVDSPSDSAQVTSNLEQPNGGLTTTDEAPEFGAADEFDAAMIEPDGAFTDAMGSDPQITAMAATADARDVILLWGRIPGDPLATQGRDWDGSVSLARGALVVQRTIAFEDRDHLMPRTALGSVSFASHTRPFADGLALRVLDPQPAAATANILTYTSADGTISYAFDLSQLASGPVVVDAGDGFKMLAIAARHHDDACAGGFMRGRFHQLRENLGIYHGLVLNRLGEPVGHIRGLYGVKKDGTPVMFGKFIDRQGKFMGILAGTYGNGDFAARWKEVGDDDHGRIRGKYFESSEVGGGVFVARWAETACTDD